MLVKLKTMFHKIQSLRILIHIFSMWSFKIPLFDDFLSYKALWLVGWIYQPCLRTLEIPNGRLFIFLAYTYIYRYRLFYTYYIILYNSVYHIEYYIEYYIVLYHIIYHIILYYIKLYYIILYHTILYYIVLYYIILYHIIYIYHTIKLIYPIISPVNPIQSPWHGY